MITDQILVLQAKEFHCNPSGFGLWLKTLQIISTDLGNKVQNAYVHIIYYIKRDFIKEISELLY